MQLGRKEDRNVGNNMGEIFRLNLSFLYGHLAATEQSAGGLQILKLEKRSVESDGKSSAVSTLVPDPSSICS